VLWRYGQSVSVFLLRKRARYMEDGVGVEGLDWRDRELRG